MTPELQLKLLVLEALGRATSFSGPLGITRPAELLAERSEDLVAYVKALEAAAVPAAAPASQP